MVECPLWVISGMPERCLLCPRKRTFAAQLGMSGLCQKRTSAIDDVCRERTDNRVCVSPLNKPAHSYTEGFSDQGVSSAPPARLPEDGP
jgi:hypothetical protein